MPTYYAQNRNLLARLFDLLPAKIGEGRTGELLADDTIVPVVVVNEVETKDETIQGLDRGLIDSFTSKSTAVSVIAPDGTVNVDTEIVATSGFWRVGWSFSQEIWGGPSTRVAGLFINDADDNAKPVRLFQGIRPTGANTDITLWESGVDLIYLASGEELRGRINGTASGNSRIEVICQQVADVNGVLLSPIPPGVSTGHGGNGKAKKPSKPPNRPPSQRANASARPKMAENWTPRRNHKA